LLFALIFVLAGCDAPTPTPANTPVTTIAGPGDTFITVQPPPPAWRTPKRALTRDNVFEMELLGRLDVLGTASTLFTHTFSPDGTRLVGLNNTNIVGWDLITGELFINNTHQQATYLFYSVDKSRLYAVLTDGRIAIYSADTGLLNSELNGHERYNGTATYDAFNGWLALGGSDGSIHVWDMVGELLLSSINAHSGGVTNLIFSPDGTRLVSSGADGKNYVWDWVNRELIYNVTNADVPTVRLAYHPLGEQLAIATRESIAIWDMQRGEFVHTLPTGAGGSDSILSYSPNGKFLINGGGIPDMMVWSGEADNHFVAYLPNVGNERISAQFSPNSEMLLTSKLNGETSLWDLTQITNETVVRANINPASSRIIAVDWSPDNFTLLFVDAGGSVYVWGLP
jgi:WD40 repeat protein